jgi:4-deoxy-L-threo-5-hexosulose-uronate ketol-isomerase
MDGPMTTHNSMDTTMKMLPDAVRAQSMDSAALRDAFLVTGLFVEGTVTLRHFDLDRVVIGGAVPLAAPLKLEAPASIASAYFCERRELGVLNIGGSGTVTVDGTAHALGRRDVLYVGRGAKDIVLASADAKAPARFYLVSYPAHATHPTTRVTAGEATAAELGTAENANRRRLAKYIHPGAMPTGQLVMGVTEMMPGSVWNTMPPHTHFRRTEVYLYFDLPADAMVVHLMGEPTETRHLIVRDGEVVLSPPWSVHAGCGTSAYTFCWAMGGENQDFADMQGAPIPTLR